MIVTSAGATLFKKRSFWQVGHRDGKRLWEGVAKWLTFRFFEHRFSNVETIIKVCYFGRAHSRGDCHSIHIRGELGTLNVPLLEKIL